MVVAPAGATITTAGGTQPFTAEARDDEGTVLSGKTFTWASLNSNVAMINSTTGVATAVASGQVTVSATVDKVTVLRYDGTSWNAIMSGTTLILRGVWRFGTSSAYAVGSDGTILLGS
ncbi:MAG: Ig-like domain-containing protein [Gemmatimonadetes bacterium]|nr:Ig-like domain-containing protein [Gemmatimonadota bacterium]